MAAMKSYVDVLLSPSTQHYLSNHTMVGQLYHTASAAFWRADFWLPPGIEWELMEENEEMPMPNFYDVWVYPLLLSVLMVLLHSFIIQPYIMEPLATVAGISNKRPSPPAACPILETLYSRHGIKPSDSQVKEATNANGMTRRQVERWLRRRHRLAQPTPFEKFADSGFDLICHLITGIYGWCTILHKPWVSDISQAYIGHPYHPLDNEVWWYYMLGLSYFWAATFMQIHLPGRSRFDKAQMMLHHLFTILLMVFSWACNFVRAGTLVLLVHDVADIPLLIGKMCVYGGFSILQDLCLILFIIVWVITRCYLYPFWFMRALIFDFAPINETQSISVFIVLLVGLLIINMIWTVLIVGVIIRKVKEGSVQDVRSDVEATDTEGEEEEVKETLHAKPKAD
ncbi:hypothetical protein Pmani_019733 [Petrolisthes manimaculis]|uniref:TLC domain-containing protein n=1 Tax=Petrolisthes manimaculis TaxID=1843537 RepID=A0AAE1PHQ4_9EUCA|nr:hypothetical protein Pmani_019733 [Petrolisthes manimaculis]